MRVVLLALALVVALAAAAPLSLDACVPVASPSGSAFAILLGNAAERTDVFSMAVVMVHRLRAQSPEHDVVALVVGPMAAEQRAAMQALGVTLVEAAVPEYTLSAPSQLSPAIADIYRSKLLVTALTQYERVMFLDVDAVVLDDLSSLFSRLSPSTSLVAVAGFASPLNAGVMLVRPSCEDAAALSALLKGDSFTVARGWNDYGPFPHWRWTSVESDWSFHGAEVEQGLLYYHYCLSGASADSCRLVAPSSLDTHVVHFPGQLKPYAFELNELPSLSSVRRIAVEAWRQSLAEVRGDAALAAVVESADRLFSRAAAERDVGVADPYTNMCPTECTLSFQDATADAQGFFHVNVDSAESSSATVSSVESGKFILMDGATEVSECTTSSFEVLTETDGFSPMDTEFDGIVDPSTPFEVSTVPVLFTTDTLAAISRVPAENFHDLAGCTTNYAGEPAIFAKVNCDATCVCMYFAVDAEEVLVDEEVKNEEEMLSFNKPGSGIALTSNDMLVVGDRLADYHPTPTTTTARTGAVNFFDASKPHFPVIDTVAFMHGSNENSMLGVDVASAGQWLAIAAERGEPTPAGRFGTVIISDVSDPTNDVHTVQGVADAMRLGSGDLIVVDDAVTYVAASTRFDSNRVGGVATAGAVAVIDPVAKTEAWINAPDGSVTFGTALCAVGTELFVSDSAKQILYKYDVADITAPAFVESYTFADEGKTFGADLGCDANVVAVGMPTFDGKGGAVALLDTSDITSGPIDTFYGLNTAAHGKLGMAVTMHNGKVFASAPFADTEQGSSAGVVFIADADLSGFDLDTVQFNTDTIVGAGSQIGTEAIVANDKYVFVNKGGNIPNAPFDHIVALIYA